MTYLRWVDHAITISFHDSFFFLLHACFSLNIDGKQQHKVLQWFLNLRQSFRFHILLLNLNKFEFAIEMELVFLLKTYFLIMYVTLQEVNNECNGNFYNPLKETCESKLAKVDEVINRVIMF